MKRWAAIALAAVLAGTAAITLGPLPVRLLYAVTDLVARGTGLPPGDLRPWVEAASNVLLFAVLAVAVLLTFPRLPPLRVVVGLAVVSMLVELAQGLFLHDRYPSLQDVALNTTGAAVGSWAVFTTRGRTRTKDIDT